MRMNRHALKRKHIRETERKYATKWSPGYSVERLRRELREDPYGLSPRNGGWEYWKIFYLSGRRRFAKKSSNKRIRQKYRRMVHNMDHEDVAALRGAEYEKEFDYAWTIW